MLYEIRKGDVLECIHCGKDVEVNDDTVIILRHRKFLQCPHCNIMADMQMYHFYGEEKQKND